MSHPKGTPHATFLTGSTLRFVRQKAAELNIARKRKQRMQTYRFNIQLYAAEFTFLDHAEKTQLVRTLHDAWQWGVQDKLEELFKQQDQSENEQPRHHHQRLR